MLPHQSQQQQLQHHHQQNQTNWTPLPNIDMNLKFAIGQVSSKRLSTIASTVSNTPTSQFWVRGIDICVSVWNLTKNNEHEAPAECELLFSKILYGYEYINPEYKKQEMRCISKVIVGWKGWWGAQKSSPFKFTITKSCRFHWKVLRLKIPYT